MPSKIFIIDDNPDDLMLLELALQSETGFDIHKFFDAASAIRSIESGTRPDLVVTDILMEPIDGMQALEAFRLHIPEVPVIVMSSTEEYFKDVLKLGARAIFRKQADFYPILDLIKDLVAADPSAPTEE